MGNDEGIPAVGVGGEPGEGGALLWAMDGQVGDVDPLLAGTRAEQIVARQIYEPLVERLAGPFQDTRRVNGLALRVRPNADRTVWRVLLRQGVRFQDGARFNASAVLANVERWRATGIGRGLLPVPFEVDAPRPHLIRFILASPDPRLERRLASTRLGIVSPRALGDDPGAFGTNPVGDDAGTGPFDLRERGGGRLLLAHNTGWWGSERGLGPAIDRLEFFTVPRGSERLRLLLGGGVQVAEGIGARGLHRLRAEPLLAALPQGGGRWRGMERSVRGIDSGRGIPSLQQVWLTTLGRG
jgi:MarR-like DNA-binding transcriptional regulator SgrR of sgrS sRNA